MGNDRPWARGLQRFMGGPPAARAAATTRSRADRFWLFRAFAVAGLSRAARSRAACWGMKRSRAAASSTGLPTRARVTRIALRVEARRYLAVAEARTVFALL